MTKSQKRYKDYYSKFTDIRLKDIIKNFGELYGYDNNVVAIESILKERKLKEILK